MSLPRTAREALQRLPAATQPLRRACDHAGDGSPLALMTAAELRALEQCLKPLDEVTSKVWDPVLVTSILSDGAIRLALLHLATAAVRTSPLSLSPHGDSAVCRLHASTATLSLGVLRTCLDKLVLSGNMAMACGFVKGLLRTDALQAASRQLASVADVLAQPALPPQAATPASASAAAPAAPPTRGADVAGGPQAATAPPPLPSLSQPALAFTLRLIRFFHALVYATCTLIDLLPVLDRAGGQAAAQRLAVRLSASLHGRYPAREHAERALLLAAPAVAAFRADRCRAQASGGGDGGGFGGGSGGRAAAVSELRKALEEAVRQSDFSRSMLLKLLHERERESAPDAVAVRLRGAVGGTCARHAAAALALAALCAADGGPAYGLPPDLLASLPFVTHASTELGEDKSSKEENGGGAAAAAANGGAGGGAGGGGRRRKFVEAARLLDLGKELVSMGRMAEPPPAFWGGRVGALSLAYRMGWLAVSSAQAHADGVGSGGGSGGSEAAAAAGAGASGRQQRRLPPQAAAAGTAAATAGMPRAILHLKNVGNVAALALQSACALVMRAPPRRRSRAAVALWPSGEDAEWWRLTVAAVTHVTPHASDEDVQAFGDCLATAVADWEKEQEQARGLGGKNDQAVWACTFPLPPAAPPAVAAALGAGMLPCLERLLRRAAHAPNGMESRLILSLFGNRSPAFIPSYFTLLLSYGDVRQGASLVATLAKLLGLIDPRVAVAAPCSPSDYFQHCVLQLALSLLWAAAQPAPKSSAAEASLAAAADRQCGALLSYAACSLLPPLSRLMLAAAPVAWPDLNGSDGAAKAAAASQLMDGLGTLLSWVPLLAAGHDSCRGSAAAGGSAREGVEAAGGSEAAASAPPCDVIDAGGWRRLVEREVGAVPLIGAAMALGPRLECAGVPQEDHATLKLLLPKASQAACWLCGEEDQVQTQASSVDAAARPSSAEPGSCSDHVDVKGAGGSGAAMAVPAAAAAAGPSTSGGSVCLGSSEVSTGRGSAPPQLLPLAWRSRITRAAAAQYRAFGEAWLAAQLEAIAAQGEHMELAGTGGFEHAWDAVLGRVVGARQRLGEEAGVCLEAEASGAHGATASVLTAGQGKKVEAGEGHIAWGVLLSPAKARRALRTCANPCCANLEGDSEAELKLLACAGCGTVGYCCRACQTAHWRAGHREACCRRQAGA